MIIIFFFFTPFLLFMPADMAGFCKMYTASHSQNKNIIQDHPLMLLVLFSPDIYTIVCCTVACVFASLKTPIPFPHLSFLADQKTMLLVSCKDADMSR